MLLHDLLLASDCNLTDNDYRFVLLVLWFGMETA